MKYFSVFGLLLVVLLAAAVPTETGAGTTCDQEYERCVSDNYDDWQFCLEVSGAAWEACRADCEEDYDDCMEVTMTPGVPWSTAHNICMLQTSSCRSDCDSERQEVDGICNSENLSQQMQCYWAHCDPT